MGKRLFTITHIFMATVMALLFNACLDETPKDKLEEDKLYTSASNLYINTIGNL